MASVGHSAVLAWLDLSVPCSPSSSYGASARAKAKLGRRGTAGRRAKSAVELRKMKRDAQFARRRGLAPADSSPDRHSTIGRGGGGGSGSFGGGGGGGSGAGGAGGAGPAKMRCPSPAVTQELNLESLSKLDEVPISMTVDAAVQPQLVRSSSCPDLTESASRTTSGSTKPVEATAAIRMSSHNPM